MSSTREGGQERPAGVYVLLVQSNAHKGSPTPKDWLFKSGDYKTNVGHVYIVAAEAEGHF